MQNTIQLPYPFSSFNLASVFDIATLNTGNPPNQIMLNSEGNADMFKSSDNFDNTMSHFLFPSTFFSGQHQCFYPKGNPNAVARDTVTEKALMKHAGQTGGSSFSIDSLLGINNVINGGLLLPSHTKEHLYHHHRHPCSFAATTVHSSINGKFSKAEQQEFCPNNNNTIKRKKYLTDHKNDNSRYQKSSSSSTNSTPRQVPKSKTIMSIKSSSPGHEINCKNVDTDKTSESAQNILRRATKTKRVRTIFTPEQLERLEAEFERQQYMVGPERLYLASSLHLTEAQVKVWFQNRRIKWRKQHLELQQQRLAVIRSQQADGFEENEESSDMSSSCAESPVPTSTIPVSASNIAIESNLDLNFSPS